MPHHERSEIQSGPLPTTASLDSARCDVSTLKKAAVAAAPAFAPFVTVVGDDGDVVAVAERQDS